MHPAMSATNWSGDEVGFGQVLCRPIARVLAHQRTPFQDALVVQTPSGAKALVLDGIWQSCTADEFLYHEPLVHVACCLYGPPRNALILGGGEGGTLREVLKWRTLQDVCMVDIDRKVVEMCRQHLPEIHQNAFADPRVRLVTGDARHFVDWTRQKWDLIISDLTDPTEGGPAAELYSAEFFNACRMALRPKGCLVVQAGALYPDTSGQHWQVRTALESAFEHVTACWSFIPSFGQLWSFLIASEHPPGVCLDPEHADAILSQNLSSPTRTFDGAFLLSSLHIPRHCREDQPGFAHVREQCEEGPTAQRP